MKKTYQQPRAEAMRVELQQMMAGSTTPENLGGGNETGDGIDVSRRSNSVWDFGDED